MKSWTLSTVSGQLWNVAERRRKTLLRLYRRQTAILLELQGSKLISVIGVIAWRWITGMIARHIGLANIFYKSCGDEEEDETIFHLLCICPALGWMRKRHLHPYYIEDLNKLACMNIDSPSDFIGNSKWLLEEGRM